MYAKMMFSSMLLFSLIAAPVAWAQSDEVEDAAHAIEEIAEALNEQSGDIAEAIENAMEENSEELEEWADRYSKQWERWAEKFENRFSSWAEEQEDLWDDWSEEYSDRWENWADQLDGKDLNGEELAEMIQRNLEMLGEMPLGQMVDGLLKEGTEGFESAPWDSLQELQHLMQDAIKSSVTDVENRMAQHELEKALMTGRKALGAGHAEEAKQDTDLDYILPVIETQQQGLKAKRKILDNEAKNALKKIAAIIETDEIDTEELKKVLKEIIGSSKDLVNDVQKEELDRAKALANQAKNRANRSRERAEQSRRRQVEQGRQRAEQGRQRAKQAYEKARKQMQKSAKNSSSDSAKANLRKTLDAFDDDGKASVEKIYKALRAEEEKLVEKSDELELLKQQIKQLRKEVEKMKSDK